MTRGVRYRSARREDLPACTRIWAASIGDYYERRLHQRWEPGDLDPLERLLTHFLLTDPALFAVATTGDEAAEEVVGFGSANRRGAVWFLSMLFVRPDLQDGGVGRALLTRLLPLNARTEAALAPDGHERRTGADRRGPDTSRGPADRRGPEDRRTGARRPILGTATDSAQPISNALYARYGMVPRLPAFQLLGRPPLHADLPSLPPGVRAIPFELIAGGPPGGPSGSPSAGTPSAGSPSAGTGHADLVAAIGAIDRAVVGHERPEDHRFLRLEGRRGFLYQGENGTTLGYGYAAPSGRLGPVAALDPQLVVRIVGHLIIAVRPPGASAIWLPGGSDDVYAVLLRAGLRIEGFPALFCWNCPVADFSRYIPISLALI